MEDFKRNYAGRDFELVYDGIGSIEISMTDDRKQFVHDFVVVPVKIFREMVEHFNAIP